MTAVLEISSLALYLFRPLISQEMMVKRRSRVSFADDCASAFASFEPLSIARWVFARSGRPPGSNGGSSQIQGAHRCHDNKRRWVFAKSGRPPPIAWPFDWWVFARSGRPPVDVPFVTSSGQLCSPRRRGASRCRYTGQSILEKCGLFAIAV